jgi:hypothetical protein
LGKFCNPPLLTQLLKIVNFLKTKEIKKAILNKNPNGRKCDKGINFLSLILSSLAELKNQSANLAN